VWLNAQVLLLARAPRDEAGTAVAAYDDLVRRIVREHGLWLLLFSRREAGLAGQDARVISRLTRPKLGGVNKQNGLPYPTRNI